jgi:sterol desaturase/sphingolipid hydroxylase (fatty acid hydroxylase superfamily)
MTTLFEFLGVWAAVYVVTFGLYLGFGALFQLYAHRHPERRIQANRRGEKRKWKEIRQSAWSLTATCFCLAFGLFAQWKGWTLVAPLELSWWSAPLMFAVSIVAFDAWFYWGHRLMHWGPMMKHHQYHHRSVAPTVWSNYSDTLLDAFVMQSYYLWAPFILPIPPAVLVAHRLYDHFNGMIGHSGFEFAASKWTRIPSPMVCTLFHDQHHSHFNYNYANFFSFWDRLMGTLHRDYDRGVERWETPAETAPDAGTARSLARRP